MTSLTEVFVTVKPDMDKFGPEVKKKLARIDSAAAGKGVATRFGLGLNGALGSVVSRSAGIFAAGFATLKVGGFLKGAISQASDLSETQSKVGQIFGSSAKDILKFSKTSATALGQTQQAALDANATFGTFGKSAGLKGAGLTGFTTKLTTLAGDLASFNNTSPEQAIEAIGAALRGESEPIRAYGVLLDDASLRQEALKQGLIKTTKQALTPQQKVLSAQALIMKQTTTAQGDFARTSGGLANQQRILSARFSDFKTSVGAVALPLAVKFFGFLNKSAFPVLAKVGTGIKAAAAAFSGEGVTSSGFVGFMERIGVVARSVFDIFKTEVIPRLKEFGGFLLNTVVPAVVAFVGNLVSTFAPAVKDVFGFFKAEVLPRLKDFAGFLGDKVVPKVTELATGLSKNKDFLVPFAATILALIVGLKAWAIIQAVLNAELFANPIGLVVLAIAALVAGVIWAFKNVGWFHDALVGAFHGIQAAAQIFAPLVKAAIDIVIGVFSLWWNYYAKPILKGFWEALKFAWERAKDFGGIVAAAFNAIKEPARAAIAFVIDHFLDFVGSILTGAAKAFGWVPKLGDKLKAAAKEFGTFRDDVNRRLAGIKDQTIKISPVVLAAQAAHRNAVQNRLGLFAAGGEIPSSMGVRGKDSVPALLMPDEHVLTTKDVSAMGGHQAVYAFRAGLHKFAAGGAVGVNVNAALPNLNRSMASIVTVAKAVAQPIAQALGNQLARFNPGLNGVLSFVKSQVGKPYVWGGVGPGGYDCSGLVSAAINTAFGRRPYSRLGATGSMPWSMFASGPGAFEVGWFQGNPGHTAATVNGVNIESAGGVGVRMGAHARGARNSLFTNRAHVKGFKDGGQVDGDLPYDRVRSRKDLRQLLGLDKTLVFDGGGVLPVGRSVVDNRTGKPEPLTRTDQAFDLTPDSIRALAKELGKTIGNGVFRLVQSGNGSYILQQTNG